MIGLQIADGLTTALAIGNGGVEASPVVAQLGLLPAKLAAITAFALLLYHCQRARIPLLICGFYAAVVLSNATFLLAEPMR